MTVPRHYSLSLDLDRATSSFSGSVTIDVEPGGAPIVLDCVGLEINNANAPILAQAETTLTLAGGVSQIEISFRGRMSRQCRGLFAGEGFCIAQMQPSNARHVFPCFDDPRFKTTFDVTATSGDDIVITNGGTGARMSPHLLFIAAGAFRVSHFDFGSLPVRLFTVDERASSESLVDAAERALRFHAEYLGIPYPWRQLDLAVVPTFEVDAMESTGAVAFRSGAVVGMPGHRVTTLVAHELAHQWFGSLVTPQSWEDLWLSEGIATWLSWKAVAAFAPEIVSPAAVASAMRAAMAWDSTSSARPLRSTASVPSGGKGQFDTLLYVKGAAVLQTLERCYGAPTLRLALRHFVERHASAHATSEDFLAALRESIGGDAVRLVSPLVFSSGVPEVEIAWRDNVVHIARAEEGSPLLLDLAVALADGSVAVHRVVLEGTGTDLAMGSPVRWVYGNAGGDAYVRTWCERFDAIDVGELSTAAATALAGDIYDAVQSGRSDSLQFLRMAAALASDSAAADLASRQLNDTRDLLATGARRPHFDAWLQSLAGTGADRRTGGMFLLAGIAGERASIARAQEITSAWLDGAEGDDLLPFALVVVATHGDSALFDRMQRRLKGESAPDARQRLLSAIASFRLADRVAMQVALLEPGTLSGTEAVVYAETLLANDVARNAAWSYIKERWDQLSTELVSFGGGGVLAGLASAADRPMRQELAAFFASHNISGDERAAARTLGRIDSRIGYREREQRMFDCWLAWQSAGRPSGTMELRTAQSLLNLTSAALEGALQTRSRFEQLGVPVPAWMQPAEDLRNALIGVEQMFLQTFSGQNPVHAALLALADRMCEDLAAAADAAASSRSAVLANEGTDAARTLAVLLWREAHTREHFLAGAIASAEMMDERDSAALLRRGRATIQRAVTRARELMNAAFTSPDKESSSASLLHEAALLPGLLGAHGVDLKALACMWRGDTTFDHAAASWIAFGFPPEEAARWRDAGISQPADAARLVSRGIGPSAAAKGQGRQ